MVERMGLRPLQPRDLAWLFGGPTVLNAIACRVVIPRIDARNALPIEANYFLSVGLLVLVPMFAVALVLSARETGSSHIRDLLARMRVRSIRRRDWLWTVLTFVGLSAASFVIANILMPQVGLDAKPFFFRNMPLAPENRWILGVWPLFFFFNIFGEELFWRGYIQPRQELLTGRWTWLIHGILWAVWHIPMGLDLIVASLPIFFILPAVVQLTKNTSVAIVVHAVFGAFGFLGLALGLIH
ncbi:MAG: CPBP family intramembrane metalloprotease [Gemmatimonadota bacterium]|jgi:membrane protease YdiL (CAAX protease family)